MFTKKMTASEACRACGLESGHNCDDESCDNNLNRIESAADTIRARKPPKSEPIKINEIDVCRQVINKHGISRQLAKAAEEFSEAAAAIRRFSEAVAAISRGNQPLSCGRGRIYGDYRRGCRR